MEFIIMDSSVLINSCLFWEAEIQGRKIFLHQRKFSECEALFGLIKKFNKDLTCIITKTVEMETINALKGAVNSFMLKEMSVVSDVVKKYGYETLKNIIRDQSLDILDDIIEGYSTRLPIDKKKVEMIYNEIESFFRKNILDTVRYIPVPGVLKRMRGTLNGKREIILEIIKNFSSGNKILYLHGEPYDKDKKIMTEATYLCRDYNDRKKVYIASLDYHFIPNPIQIESFKSPLYMMDYERVDSSMRDMLMENFGFFSDRPKELLLILSKMGFS